MLEGLEVAEIRWNALNEELRYEAEFFQQRYLHEDTALSRLPKKNIGEFAHVTDGPHGYHVVDESSPIVMLTAKNAKDWFSEREGTDPIAEWVDTANKRSSLEVDDIILSTRGSVGMCALVTEESLPANIDQDVARISWQDKKAFIPGFVVAYLNSTYGQDHIARYASGMVQQGLSLQKVRDIPIPALSSTTQTGIANAVGAALDLRRQASSHIHRAEQTLLRALGLENWQPPEPLSYARSSREAFTAGRLDSEHFKPKYAELETYIRATGHYAKLENLLTVNERGSQPDYAESGLPVVNSKHVAKGEVRLNDDNRLAMAGRNDLKIRHGDVLMNGTGVGTIGRAAPYLHSVEALPDNHVTVLRPHAGVIAPVYLSVYLNSLAGQYQVSKWLRGSSGQIELYPADIAQFLIWIAPDEVQQSIRRAIDDAFAAKRQAVVLLDAAKRAVEIAIEDSEAAALAWLANVTATLADPAASCDHGTTPEPHHDHPATATPRPAPEAMARRPSGRGEPAGGLSPAAGDLRPELHGAGAGAGGPGPAAYPAESAPDSTRPLDATRELATAAGSLTYTEVSERLAVNIVRCLDELLDAEPDDIAITPDWLRDVHRRLASELFPGWAGRFRDTDVQVGTHLPPAAHDVAVRVRDFCLDLEERLRHLSDAESIADLLAWVDWRFQWIHPFKDFNGRVGRILLVALAYSLGLPPMDPADAANRDVYFAALRAADAGDMAPLRGLWLERLRRGF